MSNAGKYVAMIQAMERHHEYQAVSHSELGAREAYLANAADWRAMREAWEAMVEALQTGVTAIETAALMDRNWNSHGLTATHKVFLAALAKARAT